MPDLDVDCDDGITANTSHDSRRVSGKGRGRRGGGGPAGSRGRGGRGSHSAPPGSRSLQSKPRPRVSASGAVGVAAAAPTVAELTQAGGALPNLLSQDDEDDDEDESESEAFRVEVSRCLSSLLAANTKQAYNTYFGKFLEWAKLHQPDLYKKLVDESYTDLVSPVGYPLLAAKFVMHTIDTCSFVS